MDGSRGGSKKASPRANRMSPIKSDQWEKAFAEGAERGVYANSPLFHSAGLAASPGRGERFSPSEDKMLAMPLVSNEAPSAAGGGGSKGGGADGAAEESAVQGAVKALLYGLINTIVVTPVMIGFAAIIFRHEAFHRDPAVYSNLVKLVVFSSAVHQTAFTATSSLPFAIGQVQDAGLIFLSKMASEVADAMKDDPPESMLATCLVTLSLSTTMLGVALIFTGYFKLAGLVQYLPLPVVGGYLAFIGLYCFEAGISLMSGMQADSLLGLNAPAQWSRLIAPQPLYFCVPGVVIGVSILLILQRYHHFLVLPALLLAIPLVFYAIMMTLGFSLDEMRDLGLVAEQQPSGNPLHVWTMFDFSKVRWDLLPNAIPTWLGMYVVVAFSSSLDVAAIQMDMGRQLDFNHELMTVGLSNLLSGATGGFTGSYIFSQTLFTFRTGTRSRLCGGFVLVAELLLFLAPFSIVSFVPKLFFGAVLTFIAADLMLDWLVLSRSKVHPIEYGVILCTFFMINLAGLELGMASGVLVAMASFIYDYAKVPVVQRVKLRSNVIRSLPLSSLLAEEQEQIITLRCRGYIFFGSTIQIMESVMRSVVLPPTASPLAAQLSGGAQAGSPAASPPQAGFPERHQAMLTGRLERAAEGGGGGGGSAVSVGGVRRPSYGASGANEGSYGYEPPSPGTDSFYDPQADMSSTAPVTRFVIFDFTMVSGLDATAARSCFLNLTRTLTPLGITIIFGGVKADSHIERLLIGHEILGVKPPAAEAVRFDTIDEALEHCEEELLRAHKMRGLPPHQYGFGTSSTLGMKMSPPPPPRANLGSKGGGPGGGGPGSGGSRGGGDSSRNSSGALSMMLSPLVEAEWSDMLEGLAPFFREKRYNNGSLIFRKGALAHSVYFITSGEVTLWAPRLETEVAENVSSSLEDLQGQLGRRLVRYVDGGIFGELDFFLRNPRSFSAVASSRDTTIQVLTRDALQSMQSQAPQLAAALEHALLKYLSFQVNAKLGLSDGVSDVGTSR